MIAQHRIPKVVADDTGRIAMYEERTEGSDGSDAVLTRYIYSNHLGSASLELDGSGEIISYEEYHPYGTTAYQAESTVINAVTKRYRYTGKERDEETGLYYHGARYYVPWLCRWSSVDPKQGEMPVWSPYNYGFCNPVTWADSTGMMPDDPNWHPPMQKMGPAELTFSNGLPETQYSGGTLEEVEVTAKRPDVNFLVPGDGQGATAASVTLKEILEYAGDAKDLIENAKEGYDVLKNASQNLGYVEKVDDGMRPLETVTMEEMAKRPFVKSEGALLKEGVKSVAKSVLRMADVVTTVADVGTKGPAYASPALSIAFEETHDRMMLGQPGEYGDTFFENVAFRQTADQGYFELADYVNATGNKSNIGFVYSSSNIIGREGVTFGSGDSAISMVDASLATSSPMSAVELGHKEKEADVNIKFAYWGKFAGNKLRIMGQFQIK